MLLIFLFILSLIYIQFGLFVSIQIVIWTIVFLLSNFLIGINPFNKEFYIIRIISVFVIILILYYNTNKIYFIASFILPLSIDKITFLNEMKVNIFIYTDTEESEIFYLFEVNETSEFLNRLDDDDNYVFLLNLWVIFQFLMKMLQKWFFRNLFW